MAEKKKTSFVAWGVIAIILLAVYGGMNSNSKSSSPGQQTVLSESQKQEISKDAEERAASSFQVDLIFNAKKDVHTAMKDPESTKFQNVFVNETEKGGAVVCGNYDSKNSLGAYGGWKRFMSNGKTTFLEERDKNIADVWVDVCLKP